MPTSNPLADLRDIILPTQGEHSLPALGWWLLGGLVILVIIASIWLFWRYWHNRRFQRIALRQLADLESAEASAQAVNQLLKQTAQSYFARQQVASLSGDKWFEFLNSQTASPIFTTSQIETLQRQFYAQEQTATTEQINATRQWLKKALPPRKRRLR